MNPKISTIVEKLNQHWIIKKRFSNMDQDIRGVKLLTPSLDCFEDNILYIGFYREFLGIDDQTKVMNALVIEDTEKIGTFLEYGNCIILNSQVTKEELLNTISDLLLDSQYFVQSSAALFYTIIQGRGLSYIMEVASELLGNPVMLGDANHRLLAASKFDYVDDEPWMEYRNIGFSTYEYTQKYGFKKWIEVSVKTGKPVIGDLGEKYKYKRIFCTVVIDKRIVGHFAALEYNRSFSKRDLEITEFICDVIASEMKRNKHYGNTRNLMVNRLMVDLLQESYSSKEMVQERIHYLKWKIPEKKYILAIRFNSYEETFSLISYLREALQEKLFEKEVVIYENHLVLIIGCALSEQLKRQDFKMLIDFLQKNNLIAGISQSFIDVLETKKCYEQALLAMELGRKAGKVDALFMYENYVVYDIIKRVCKQQEPLEFCHPAVLKLREYDRKHKTEYLKSLYTYITTMGNLVASAEALFIHRNTMSYRLSKIQEIIELDLTDHDMNMNLFFSYKILEYTGEI